jgi:multisubunit Na+/H+ antiporter MnhC subunit
LILLLFAVGLYGLLSQKNLVKLIISMSILECAADLLLIAAGWRANGSAPVIAAGQDAGQFALASVDPLPQAMVLISIAIGLALLLLLTAIALRLYHEYGTYDLGEIRRLRG